MTESSKEGYGSKSAVLPMTMMEMAIWFMPMLAYCKKHKDSNERRRNSITG
jgi:hypothetical protein